MQPDAKKKKARHEETGPGGVGELGHRKVFQKGEGFLDEGTEEELKTKSQLGRVSQPARERERYLEDSVWP